MSEVVMWIIIGALAAIIIGFVAYKIISILKTGDEEKKKIIISFLVGLVNSAEGAIGSGHGKEKLEQVEKWFYEKAPFVYKIMLKILGKENLKQLIESALKQIKENFEK